jgi:hypothetical protein
MDMAILQDIANLLSALPGLSESICRPYRTMSHIYQQIGAKPEREGKTPYLAPVTGSSRVCDGHKAMIDVLQFSNMLLHIHGCSKVLTQAR